MKLLHAFAVAAAALVGATAVVSAEEPKQLFHVTAPKAVFDATLPKFHGELDVWHMAMTAGDKVKADIYATEADIALFQQRQDGKVAYYANETLVERDAVNTEQLLATRAATRATCATTSRRRQLEQTASTKYVDNAFFDCFRQSTEVYAFFDQLVAENPTIFSKIAKVTTTYQGRTVPGYKISTGSGRKPLYTQALIHAREWIAGSSTFYTMAALIDALKANDTAVTAIFQQYDWHFVPILNLDGYLYTWSSTRLWRKNRRLVSGSTYGVDLNRNYGPASYFGLAGDGPTAETYPGTAVLSEPETAGSWAYVKSLGIYGAIDMHSYAGLVLRAYGNKQGTPPAPYGPKLKVLGDAVTKAAGSSYTSETSAQLYVAYGCFDDAIFQELNKPVLTIEMAGSSFVASESTIRTAGLNMYKGFVAFGQGMPTYWSGL
ncbi:hypothetical protein Gpo141_00013594 [Globisporangium polare]